MNMETNLKTKHTNIKTKIIGIITVDKKRKHSRFKKKKNKEIKKKKKIKNIKTEINLQLINFAVIINSSKRDYHT